jgi:hypothetical protein
MPSCRQRLQQLQHGEQSLRRGMPGRVPECVNAGQAGFATSLIHDLAPLGTVLSGGVNRPSGNVYSGFSGGVSPSGKGTLATFSTIDTRL